MGNLDVIWMFLTGSLVGNVLFFFLLIGGVLLLTVIFQAACALANVEPTPGYLFSLLLVLVTLALCVPLTGGIVFIYSLAPLSHGFPGEVSATLLGVFCSLLCIVISAALYMLTLRISVTKGFLTGLFEQILALLAFALLYGLLLVILALVQIVNKQRAPKDGAVAVRRAGRCRFTVMILEGIVTTIAVDGGVNIAPMGPHVTAETFERFLLKPFRTAHTYRNLKVHGEGVLHISDDVLLLARAAVGTLEPLPPLLPAEHVRGWILRDACRYFEFRITRCDDQSERAVLEAEVIHTGRLRDFFGFNRAKHAVVEAAILATRLGLLPRDEIETEYRKLAVLVQKTGGARELEAFAFLQAYVASAVQSP